MPRDSERYKIYPECDRSTVKFLSLERYRVKLSGIVTQIIVVFVYEYAM